MQNRKQYLLFGCVELYPNEIPAPPSKIKPQTLPIHGATAVSTVTVMSVLQGLAWYESALNGELAVPGLSRIVPVTTAELSPEPALGRLLLAKDLPFACPWHGRPSIHHLVPMNEPPEALEWLSPDANSAHRSKLRSWLTNALGFDVLAYDEFLFGLVLLVPNPALRGFACSIRGNLEGGGERIGVSLQPRRGEVLDDVRVWFKETRPEGTLTVLECKVDSLGRAEFDLPERCGLAAVEVHSDRYGILGMDEPHRFWRGVTVDSEVLTTAGSIKVPPRRKGEPEESAPLHARDRKLALRRHSRPASAEHRLIELQSRRDSRSNQARPDGFWQGYAGEEVIFDGNREEAVTFIRHAVHGALHRVIWIDPYFNHIDLREFTFATQYVEVQVHVLVGRDHLHKTVDEQMPDGQLVGDVFAEDLQALAEELAGSHHRVPDVYLLGGPARNYHDRFLVVDDFVWHFGHSFNQVGEAALSMATRLRQPNAVRDLILEDLARAELFTPTWPDLKAARAAAQVQSMWPTGSLP
jgi:hypothetical protein